MYFLSIFCMTFYKEFLIQWFNLIDKLFFERRMWKGRWIEIKSVIGSEAFISILCCCGGSLEEAGLDLFKIVATQIQKLFQNLESKNLKLRKISSIFSKQHRIYKHRINHNLFLIFCELFRRNLYFLGIKFEAIIMNILHNGRI